MKGYSPRAEEKKKSSYFNLIFEYINVNRLKSKSISAN